VDELTIKAYSKNSTDFLKRYPELKPYRMHELIDAFFHKAKETVDIGCASGRDIKLLKDKGFVVTGVDAVFEFVEHCKKAYPDTDIINSPLPKLDKLKDESFNNVLLCAVLMHLKGEDLIEAVSNILRVTRKEGRILISFRPASQGDDREQDGRLFNPIAPVKLINLFEGFGAKLLFQEESEQDFHGQKKLWHNLVFEKVDLSKKSGIESIQEIFAKDKKDTSYKAALLGLKSYCTL
jgi:SAM-dependent methyltransferase